jgi:hypothetical protein
MFNTLTRILTVGTIAFSIALPTIAPAQSRKSQYERRQETKNEWRNIGIASGVVAILGLLNDDPTLTFVGAAGALYSAHRYEQDRKSQNSLRRARATYFSKPYFYRNGTKYARKTVYKNGKKYYQFVKVKSKDR